MYGQNEIELSKKHLEEVIGSIEGPTVVLGGWAVCLLVNEKYKETTGREYIGSRDIDLGFKISPADLETSAFTRVFRKLIDDLGFRPLSYRMFKEMDMETGKLLDERAAKQLPSYQIFQMYIDLVVSQIPQGFREHFGFTPIDEPLLELVFAEECNRIEKYKFGRTIWLPTPNILLAMKIKSYPNRQMDHKRIKDIADIAALVLFTTPRLDAIEKLDIERFKEELRVDDTTQAAEILGLDARTVENAIRRIDSITHTK